MRERWKDIPGFERFYQISNTGKVKSLKRTIIRDDGHPYSTPEKILAQQIGNRGYKIINLQKNGRKNNKTFSVHRFVALAFVPNILCLSEVNHKDRDKLNNNDWNLEWTSIRENNTHKWMGEHKTSKYPNVNFNDAVKTKKWLARIMIGGKSKHLGRFKSEKEAYMSVLKAIDENGITNRYIKVA